MGGCWLVESNDELTRARRTLCEAGILSIKRVGTVTDTVEKEQGATRAHSPAGQWKQFSWDGGLHDGAAP